MIVPTREKTYNAYSFETNSLVSEEGMQSAVLLSSARALY